MACRGDCCKKVARLEAELGQKNLEIEILKKALRDEVAARSLEAAGQDLNDAIDMIGAIKTRPADQ